MSSWTILKEMMVVEIAKPPLMNHTIFNLDFYSSYTTAITYSITKVIHTCHHRSLYQINSFDSLGGHYH
jgi:hypothetical protein